MKSFSFEPVLAFFSFFRVLIEYPDTEHWNWKTTKPNLHIDVNDELYNITHRGKWAF